MASSLCPVVSPNQAKACEADAGGSDLSVAASCGTANGVDDVAVQDSRASSDPIVDWTDCGTARWMIDAGGCLTIAPQPGEAQGELANWESPYAFGAPWCSYAKVITSTKFEGTVVAQTACGMFWNCESLASIDLAGLDISHVKSMRSMFWKCSSLASIDLSVLDTSNVTDMDDVFWGCSSLTSIDVTCLDMSKVTSLLNFFNGCSKLATVDFEGLNTSNVTEMSQMFMGCTSLVSVDLSVIDTSSVRGMSAMFLGCTNLASFDFTGVDISNVSSINSMFRDCSSLSSVNLKGVNFSSVVDMAGMFYGCSALSSVDLSSLDTSHVEIFDRLFENCTSLTSVNLGGLDTSSATGMRYMFNKCSSLPSLDLSSFDTSHVFGMDSMFAGCDALRSVTLGTGFSFAGQEAERLCGLPSPAGENLTGLWVSSADGKAYAADAIPNNVAAVYTAQRVAYAFPDVDYSEWYGDGVTFVSEKGLITGYSDSGLFGVGDVLTRAQLATILWRNACPDEYAEYDPATAKDTTGIAGSADGTYYTAAANWAVREGVITGFVRPDGSQDFAAGEPVTFEQLITILSRIGAAPGEVAAAGGDLSAFIDGSQADAWAVPALAWAAQEGLVAGYDEPEGKCLRPAEDVARERVAVVLMRAFQMGILE